MNILVVDVGGTHVKLLATGKTVKRQLDSGPRLTPRRMVAAVKTLVADWKFEAVSIGVPAPVVRGRIVAEPVNLGAGWKRFDFAAAFERPVKLINDAAMQALGSYRRGRMLFLGIGTGLGSALVTDGVVVPLELAHLPYRKGRSFEEYVGVHGLKRLGKKRWRKPRADRRRPPSKRDRLRRPRAWRRQRSPAEAPAARRSARQQRTCVQRRIRTVDAPAVRGDPLKRRPL